MELVDVSVAVRPAMVVYEGDPPVRVERVTSLEAGDPATVSRLELGSHTGTHVDAPAHFLPGGAGVEALPLDALVGPAQVVDARQVDGVVDAAALAALAVPAGTERLLLRTRGGELWDRPGFSPDFVGWRPTRRGRWWRRACGWWGWTTCRWRPTATPSPPTGCCSAPGW